MVKQGRYAASHRSNLAPELSPNLSSSRHDTDCAGDTDRAVALLSRDERRGKIPAQAGRQGLAMNAAATSVKAATGSDDRANPCLQITNPHLVPNVARLPQCSFVVCVSHAEVAAGGDANSGIIERAH